MAASVSIILPVHNGAATVARTVRSVLGQSYRDFELLAVDDGSTDETARILRDLARDDKRLRVLERGRGGVSSARNVGLLLAGGTYVGFVDADDEPEKNWLATLVEGIEGSELSVCGYAVKDEEGKRLYGTADLDLGRSLSNAGRLHEGAERFTCDLFSNKLMYQGYVWNKLFLRSVIERGKPLSFDRGIAFNEDRLFVYKYLRRIKDVSFSPKECYVYHAHPGPTEYEPSQATELVAFERMIDDLDKRAEDVSARSALARALHYANKDHFRALVTLYLRARESWNPDVLWLGEEVQDCSEYAGEFRNYPQEFQDDIKRAVELAEAAS